MPGTLIRSTMAAEEVFKKPSSSLLKKKPTSVKKILQDYQQGNRREYDALLHGLQDPDIEVSTLLLWLKDLKKCTSLITKEFEPLIRAILQVKWCNYDSKVVKAYQEVLETLVSAHTVYLTHILAALTQSLVPEQLIITASMDVSNPGEEREHEVKQKKKFIAVHKTLKMLLHIAPVTPQYLIVALGESFPWTGHSACILDGYIKNLLEIANYLPELRAKILELILHRMTELDVNAPKQEIIESAQTTTQETSDGQDEEHMQFDMEGVEESDGSNSKPTDKEDQAERITHEVALKLDQIMCTVMEYLHTVCFVNGEFQLEEAKVLHRHMLLVFEKVLLRTHGSSHVQFLFYYFCSFRQAIVDAFLEHLWKKFVNPNTPAVIRQVASSYIASFIARADFIPISTVTACLDLMVSWIHSYIDNQESVLQQCQADVSLHLPFYSLCQAILYVFVFRHRQLIEDNKGLRYVMGLNFERIVTCRLNPLRVCLPSVVNVFATLARNYQVAFCYTILERNARSMLPVIITNPNGEGSKVKHQNPLDSFFPFDPYLLPRSGKLIESLYRNWEGCKEDDQTETEEEDDEFVQYETLDKDLPMGITPTSLACVSPGFRTPSSYEI
ncbi:RNA polymerase I-specific transcription initiation factor RRN3-like [Amphiura filiformis]|uniref:RNA polymerase I-specific transcription initiation factor RRN3-like n=1 Tax=Amphiura filiformis TaxID=82378 RepID=UPI003B215E54